MSAGSHTVEAWSSSRWRPDDEFETHTRLDRTVETSDRAMALAHPHSVALHFMHYNFVKIHSTLRTTPAGETERLWEIEDLVGLLEQ